MPKKQYPAPTEPGWYWYMEPFKNRTAVVYVNENLWFEFHVPGLWFKGSVKEEKGTWGPRVEEWTP